MPTLPTAAELQLILFQMKERGRAFDDEMADYLYGELRTYYYDLKKQSFACRKTDSIAGSYEDFETLSLEEIRAILAGFSSSEFLAQGFSLVGSVGVSLEQKNEKDGR